jgi:hypothetical protein
MRFELLPIIAALCGCEKQPDKQPGTVVDEGTIFTEQDGKLQAKETFSIRRVGDHLVTRASSDTVPDVPRQVHQEGELETDLAWHPLRLTYQYAAKPEGFRYTLGGTPLALDRTRDDGKQPEHVVATGPIDVFVEGPGLIAMTALCKVDKPATLETLSDSHSAYRGKIVVKSVGTAAKLKKLVVKFLDDFEIEVFCDGDKLVASGLRGNNLWNIRGGREADYAAARDAP